MSAAAAYATPVEELERARAGGGDVLTADLAAFCQSGVSVVLGARGQDGRPVAGVALGCTVTEDGWVRVLLRRPANLSLLEGLAAGSSFAATFSEPTTHRSIQLKSRHPQPDAPTSLELSALARQTLTFRRTLEAIDYTAAFAAHYCHYRDEEIAVIAFRPEEAFVQTPGPGAGGQLGP